MKVRRALVSVSDKSGIVEFCKSLSDMGVEIISTGGTAKTLTEAGIQVTGISEVTEFPEMLDGRVKTLHPAVHGGLLADRRKDEHLEQIDEAGIDLIDMVVVNLYPFEATVAKPDVTMDEAIEKIDIGGPSMLRSAAKNFEGVAVITDPSDYEDILAELTANDGTLSRKTRVRLSREVFRKTAAYDAAIYSYLEPEKDFPNTLIQVHDKVQDLRYGENPHQRGAFYRERNAAEHTLARAEQLHGKELSYNNILDADAAWALVKEFTDPACVIIKHTNPCGAALGQDLKDAYVKALASDPVSAFGSIIAVNRPLDKAMAEEMSDLFVEAILAPAFPEDGLKVLTQKENLRILYMGEDRPEVASPKMLRSVEGGMLVQDLDTDSGDRAEMKVVSDREPTEDEWQDLLFGWKVAKHVKSNTITLTKELATVGVGAGQMSRVDSAMIAVRKAGPERAEGSVASSDAFMPFPDALEVVAEAGCTALIQPGGSKGDDAVLEKAAAHDMAVVFTGKRHFRH